MTAWGVSEGRSRISRLSFRVPSAPCTAIWTGIMRAVAPKTPRMAASRSSVNAPMGAPVLTILKGIHGRGQGCHYFCRGHGQRNRPGLEDGMAASQQLPGINIGNGAGCGNLQIAADQLCADRGARLHGGHRDRAWRRIRQRRAAAATRGDGFEACPCHFLLPEANCLRMEPAHEQGRFHGLKGHAPGGSHARQGASFPLAVEEEGRGAGSLFRLAVLSVWIGRSRTSIICSIGVMPAMGSLLN